MADSDPQVWKPMGEASETTLGMMDSFGGAMKLEA
jgi:hypothetical protein